MVWAGVCVRGGVGCFEGVWRSHRWWLWGWEGVYTQKIHRSRRNHIKYKGEPADKKYLREVGWGVDGGYTSHQGEQIPLSRNRIPGPGALREEPYMPSWPLGPLYTVPFLFILSLKIVQMLILHLVDYIFSFLTRFFSCRVSHSSFYGRTGVSNPAPGGPPSCSV